MREGEGREGGGGATVVLETINVCIQRCGEDSECDPPLQDQTGLFPLPWLVCSCMGLLQVVVASYDRVFPAVDEQAKDVEDNCESPFKIVVCLSCA